jgi:hypothetical protein
MAKKYAGIQVSHSLASWLHSAHESWNDRCMGGNTSYERHCHVPMQKERYLRLEGSLGRLEMAPKPSPEQLDYIASFELC